MSAGKDGLTIPTMHFWIFFGDQSYMLASITVSTGRNLSKRSKKIQRMEKVTSHLKVLTRTRFTGLENVELDWILDNSLRNE